MTREQTGTAPSSDVAAILAAVDERILVELVGSPDAVAALTSGARALSTDEAIKVASYLDISPASLTGEVPLPLAVSLRMGALEGVDDVRPVVEHASKLLDVDRLVAYWGLRDSPRSLSGFALSRDSYAKKAGSTTARRLRAYLGIQASAPVGDLAELIESLGHPTESRALPEGVHGMSVREKREADARWIVVINSSDWWSRQRYTMAHELCHVLYDDEGQVIVERAELGDRTVEWRADSFARHLLLPDEALRVRKKDAPSVRTTKDAARFVADLMLTYGVSRDVVLIAIEEQQLLAAPLLEACRESTVSWIMSTAGRASEWQEYVQMRDQPIASARLTSSILDAYARELVGLQVVADVIAEGDIDRAKEELHEAGWSA